MDRVLAFVKDQQERYLKTHAPKVDKKAAEKPSASKKKRERQSAELPLTADDIHQVISSAEHSAIKKATKVHGIEHRPQKAANSQSLGELGCTPSPANLPRHAMVFSYLVFIGGVSLTILHKTSATVPQKAGFLRRKITTAEQPKKKQLTIAEAFRKDVAPQQVFMTPPKALPLLDINVPMLSDDATPVTKFAALALQYALQRFNAQHVDTDKVDNLLKNCVHYVKGVDSHVQQRKNNEMRWRQPINRVAHSDVEAMMLTRMIEEGHHFSDSEASIEEPWQDEKEAEEKLTPLLCLLASLSILLFATATK